MSTFMFTIYGDFEIDLITRNSLIVFFHDRLKDTKIINMKNSNQLTLSSFFAAGFLGPILIVSFRNLNLIIYLFKI